MRERLADLIQSQGNLSVVLDLHRVSFIDSSGLKAIVTAHKWLQARGGRLRLVGPNKPTRKIFEITGLTQVLTVVEP